MQLVCEKCGAENDFHKCIFVVQSIEVDGRGRELGRSDFEPLGLSPWYQCAICGSEVGEAPEKEGEDG